MDFAEKLNYLFDLTHAEGKELAAAMCVTPPQISKMRKGVRGMPKDKDSAQVLARFFAQRCGSDFHREALSKATKVAQIRTLDDEDALTSVLLNWLSTNENTNDHAANRADAFLRQFGTLFASNAEGVPSGDVGQALVTEPSRFFAYYGSEGKRLAVRTFLNYLRQRRQPYQIDILTDESIAWITDDPTYSAQLSADMVSLTGSGCVFRRIVGPISDMDQAFESLNRWLPLYLTGKATSYYYKRMRDSLNRITLFAVPGVAALFSLSVGSMPQQSAVTFFTIDPKTVDAMAVEFEHYLSFCEPIMNVYSTEESLEALHACMLAYEGCPASCIQRSDSLSFITLPWDVAMSLQTSYAAEEKEVFLTSFAKRYKKFKSNIGRHSYTDIVRLADIDSIMAGTVPIPAAAVLGGERQFYSASDYLAHLRSVLYLLEHRQNYHVVLREPDDMDLTILYVKEGHCAILARDGCPFTIFEVSEQYLVGAFAEYLHRIMPLDYDKKASRRNVIAVFRGLIKQIEARLMEAFEAEEAKAGEGPESAEEAK